MSITKAGCEGTRRIGIRTGMVVCHQCGKSFSYAIAVDRETPHVCPACEKKEREKKRSEANRELRLTALTRLTLEHRVAKIERWIAEQEEKPAPPRCSHDILIGTQK